MHAFLYHGCQAGLDMGIVNAGMLAVYDEIEPELRKRVEAVVLNQSKNAGEELLAHAKASKTRMKTENPMDQTYPGAKNQWRKD